MNEKLIDYRNVSNYRFQLFPSAELIKLVKEALKVSPDPIIHNTEKGWFPRLVRTSLTVYIAYCKTLASEKAGK